MKWQDVVMCFVFTNFLFACSSGGNVSENSDAGDVDSDQVEQPIDNIAEVRQCLLDLNENNTAIVGVDLVNNFLLCSEDPSYQTFSEAIEGLWEISTDKGYFTLL